MIYFQGSLIANMLLGIVILKKKYAFEKYMSVLLITVGIIICTFYSSQQTKSVSILIWLRLIELSQNLFQACTDCDLQKNNIKEDSGDHFFWWIIGIFLLTGALLLSASMGIFQEQLYKNHGKHPEEALYYTVSIKIKL